MLPAGTESPSIRPVDSAQYERRVISRDFDIIFTGWAQSSSPGNEQIEFFGSGSADREGSRNYGSIRDPAVDAIIRKIVHAPDRAGLAAADAALDGNRVTLITTDMAIGELVNVNLRTPLYKRFLGKGASFRSGEALARIEGRDLVTRNLYSGAEARVSEVDILVDWRGNQAVDALSTAIASHGLPCEVIGDSLAPRQVHIAIAEGALAARRL